MTNNDQALIAKQTAERLAREWNIVTNGRWGMAGLLAIALQQDLPGFALAWALVLLASHLAEQMQPKRRVIAYLAIVAWVVLIGLWFAAVVLL